MPHRIGPHTKSSLLLYLHGKNGEGQFSQIGRDLGLSDSALATALKVMAHDGLVQRLVLGVLPARTKWVLTPCGKAAAIGFLEAKAA
jgi:DNA-binding HxlR family transcriptional regulator